jgi:transcriptional regulator with XRE-family HTH domain
VADLRVVFGRRVRQLREERQMLQEQLAQKAGCHVTYLSQVEGGKRNPGLVLIGRLARALGVSIAELFEGHKP